MLLLVAVADATVRCDVHFEEPGYTLDYASWGEDETDARRAALDDARLLAALGLALDARMPDHLSQRAETHGNLGVAGATATIRSCEHDAADGASTARWPEGPARTRDTAAAALEATRRGCLARMEPTVETAMARPDLDALLVDLRQKVHACWSGAYTLTPATAPRSSAGRYACTAWGADAGQVGHAWGDSLSSAREAAEARRAAVVFGMGAGIVAASNETTNPSLAEAKLKAMLGFLADPFAHGDLVDRGRTSCRRISGATRMTWPPPAAAAGTCRQLPIATSPATVAASEAATSEVCDAVFADYPHWDVLGAPGRVSGEATFCAASCRSSTQIDADAGTPVALPDVPDRSTETAARARLADAVARRDFDLASLVVPELDRWQGRQALAAAPDQLWATLAAPDRLAWSQRADGWVAGLRTPAAAPAP